MSRQYLNRITMDRIGQTEDTLGKTCFQSVKYHNGSNVSKTVPRIQEKNSSRINCDTLEKVIVVKELSALINKYGFERLSEALDTILAKK